MRAFVHVTSELPSGESTEFEGGGTGNWPVMMAVNPQHVTGNQLMHPKAAFQSTGQGTSWSGYFNPQSSCAQNGVKRHTNADAFLWVLPW